MMRPFASTLRRLLLGPLTALALLLPTGCSAAPLSGYKVVARYPHAASSFTEGFFYLNGLFYEGTGINGQSALEEIQPETGKVLRRVDEPPQYFGEGIVAWGPDIYQWTWKSGVGFVYDRSTFRLLRQFSYTGEGWGMTHTEKEIVTSDGSATLRFRDPDTFRELRSITVHDGLIPVWNLNELEWIKGQIYANVWRTDRIARISPADGRVLGWIDLAGLLPAEQRLGSEAVLNGIAYDQEHDRIFVTGKQWPWVFEIKVVDPAAR